MSFLFVIIKELEWLWNSVLNYIFRKIDKLKTIMTYNWNQKIFLEEILVK